jgi:hypothetical protein
VADMDPGNTTVLNRTCAVPKSLLRRTCCC